MSNKFVHDLLDFDLPETAEDVFGWRVRLRGFGNRMGR